MADFDFSTLITDRSQADLQALRDLLATPIADWTAEQLAQFNQAISKGAYNYTDLNRVTAAMDAIHERLTELGYQTGYERVQVPHQGGGGSVLPEGYTRLEYIQTTGTQYIDTGVQSSPTSLRVKMEFEYTAAHDTASLFGSSIGAQYTIVPYGPPTFYVAGSSAISQLSTVLNTKYDFEVSAINGTLSVNLNGTTQTTAYSGTLLTTVNIALFGHNVNGVVQQLCSLKCYRATVYVDDEIMRDFIPVKAQSGVIGLYDLLNGVFYQNAGTGEFVAGGEMQPDDEESDPESAFDPYTWYESDTPTQAQMTQYLANVEALKGALSLADNAPELPPDMDGLTTQEANHIEEILVMINLYLLALQRVFLRSGMAWAVSGGAGFYFAN